MYFTPSSLPSFQKWTSLLQFMIAAAAAKSLQSYPTLCNPIDSSPSGSPTPGILQARTLEWVAISFSNAWKWKVKVKSFSRVRLLATPWTAAYQAPPSMEFPRQEYWSGVPSPSLTIYDYGFFSLCFVCSLWLFVFPQSDTEGRGPLSFAHLCVPIPWPNSHSIMAVQMVWIEDGNEAALVFFLDVKACSQL